MLLGALFTIAGAFFFGISTVTMRRGVATGSALNGLYLSLIPGVPLFWLAALATGQVSGIGTLSGSDLALLMAAGVIHFLVGRYCTLRAMAILGANRASPIIVSSTLVSVVAAIAFLDESVTLLTAFGIALVIAGPAIASGNARPKRAAATAGAAPARVSATDDIPRPLLIKGVGWAMLNAVAFGTSPLLIRAALGDTGLGVLGGAISYSTAGMLLAMLLLLPSERASLRGVPPSTRNWFLASAVIIMAAQLFRYLGLTYAPVTIAVPLLRSQVVFIYIMSFLVNREMESFNRNVVVGMAVAIAGSVMLVL